MGHKNNTGENDAGNGDDRFGFHGGARMGKVKAFRWKARPP
jgi:hypothetical protein